MKKTTPAKRTNRKASETARERLLRRARLKPARLWTAREIWALGKPPGILTCGTPEFEAELERRVADIKSGRDKGVPAELVFAEARRRLREAANAKKRTQP